MKFNILNNAACCTPKTACCEMKYPIAIIGSGPIGLAAAANLKANGLPFIILEKSDKIAANVANWDHIQLFSPWKFNVDQVAKQLLEQNGWSMPDENVLPTGAELREQYLLPLSEVFKEQIRFNEEVISISKLNADKMKSNDR